MYSSLFAIAKIRNLGLSVVFVIIALFLACDCLVTNAIANPKEKDESRYEVIGLKPGMSVDDARDILKRIKDREMNEFWTDDKFMGFLVSIPPGIVTMQEYIDCHGDFCIVVDNKVAFISHFRKDKTRKYFDKLKNSTDSQFGKSLFFEANYDKSDEEIPVVIQHSQILQAVVLKKDPEYSRYIWFDWITTQTMIGIYDDTKGKTSSEPIYIRFVLADLSMIEPHIMILDKLEKEMLAIFPAE